MAKRYYWLKLMDDFFTQPRIKKLRKIAGGDTYTIIYLKMMLLSINDGGKLYFEGMEDNFVDDLALRIDEEPDNVKFTVLFLLNQGLMECVQDGEEYLLHEAASSIGTETDKAAMMRSLRERRKAQGIGNPVTGQLPSVTKSYTDKEIDIDKEIDKEIDIDNNLSIPAGTDERKSATPKSKSVSKKDCEQAFNDLWSLYPKKQGKTNAYKALQKALKEGESLETIKAGLMAALEHWRTTKTDIQYIPMGSTWFNQRRWQDDWASENKPELGSRFAVDIMG